MDTTYASVVVDVPETSSELAQDILHENQALGLEIRDSEAPPMPGVRAPDPGEAIVIGFFDDNTAARTAKSQLESSLPEARVALEEVPTQDWSNNWKSLIRATEVGRLWVGPPWEAPRAPANKFKITIEPKMAFGTGDHPTTRLCLLAVDEFLRAHPGASLLDVGTGTGVLAIAAKKLGAGRVVGVDNDSLSVELARENVELNQTSEIELSDKPLQAIDGTFDLVVANILANTLVELAPGIAPRVGRRLVLAGVLGRQQAEVAVAYERLGLKPDGTAAEGDWVRLDFTRA